MLLVDGYKDIHFQSLYIEILYHTAILIIIYQLTSYWK